MATQNLSTLTLPIKLTGAVVANRFVTPVGAQTAADGYAIGVARSAGSTGDVIPVDIHGTAVVEAGAAVAVGATIKADASGRAITWATSGAKIAIALEAATAAGQMIEVLQIDNVA